MILLANAGRAFAKGDPENFIPPAGIDRIVERAELKKNDYNIFPIRHIHTGYAETYRPPSEIVAKLDVSEAEVREADKALQEILGRIGV